MLEDLKDLSDASLVELSKENPDVFEELVLRYQKRLFFFIKRISYFEAEDIEDILQDVFVKVYKNLNAFDLDLKFSTWIYQITRNSTIDAIRKKHARPNPIRLEDEELAKIFKASVDLEREMIAKNDVVNLKVVLEELPFKYREVLILRFLEEKTYEEMVDILKKPHGTVAALINRGRKMLIKSLNEKSFKKDE